MSTTPVKFYRTAAGETIDQSRSYSDGSIVLDSAKNSLYFVRSNSLGTIKPILMASNIGASEIENIVDLCLQGNIPTESDAASSTGQYVDYIDLAALVNYLLFSGRILSDAQKAKLNGIASGAEVNQNAFSNITVGGTTIQADSKTDTLTLEAGSNVTITPDANSDKITIAAKDTTYSEATTSKSGLMSSGDKSKLDAIAAGAEVNQKAFSAVKVGTTTLDADSKTATLTLAAGTNVTISPNASTDTVTISAKDTTYADVKGATASAAGTRGLVPAPAAGDQGKYLRGDGTWGVPTNTDTKVTQNLTSSNADYPILLAPTGQTETATTTANFATKFKANPSTGTIIATTFSGNLSGKASTAGRADSAASADSASSVAWSGITGVPSSFTPSAHTHDDRYYTESEMDTKLAAKAAKAHTHVDADIESVSASKLTGTIPTSLLPSFVDDVLEGYYNSSDGKFYKSHSSGTYSDAYTGETGKIYVDLSSNKTYRWSGSAYAVISETLALGETSSTAYRGDLGKVAYTHSQASGNPHGTTIADISGLQSAIDGKAPTSHASSGTTYGVSTAANYGHAKASSTTPKANGTAAVGTETASFARGDHVHPLQTSVSGNAGTADKWKTTRKISISDADGTNTGVTSDIDGSGNVVVALPATIKASVTGNAATATKATQDSVGQQIDKTYIKGLSVSGQTVTYTKGDGTTGTITTQDTKYTHPTSAGYKHIPSGGAQNQYLKWADNGTAAWANIDTITTDTIDSMF